MVFVVCRSFVPGKVLRDTPGERQVFGVYRSFVPGKMLRDTHKIKAWFL
jgi:hypothetical protein